MIITDQAGPGASVVYRPWRRPRGGYLYGMTMAQTYALFIVVMATISAILFAGSLVVVAIAATVVVVLTALILAPIHGRTLGEWIGLRYELWKYQGRREAEGFRLWEHQLPVAAPLGLMVRRGGPDPVAVGMTVRPLGGVQGPRWLVRSHCDALVYLGAVCRAAEVAIVIDPAADSADTGPKVRVTYTFEAERGAGGAGRPGGPHDKLTERAAQISRHAAEIRDGAAKAGLDVTALSSAQWTAVFNQAYRQPLPTDGADERPEAAATDAWDHLVHNGYRSTTRELTRHWVRRDPGAVTGLLGNEWEHARLTLLYRFDAPDEAIRILDLNYKKAMSSGLGERVVDNVADARWAVIGGAALAQERTLLTVTAGPNEPLPASHRALRSLSGDQLASFAAALGTGVVRTDAHGPIVPF